MRDSLVTERDYITQTVGRPTFVVQFNARRTQDEIEILCDKHLAEADSAGWKSYVVIGRTGRICQTCWERADGR